MPKPGVNCIAFYLLDTEPPTCPDCPADIVKKDIVLSGVETTVRINWYAPNCTDNSGVLPSVKTDKQPGDLFSVPGSYEIVYTVSDGTNEDKNCSFRITLKSEYLPTCQYFLRLLKLLSIWKDFKITYAPKVIRRILTSLRKQTTFCATITNAPEKRRLRNGRIFCTPNDATITRSSRQCF